MKLMFLTFSTMSSNAGHLARLSSELEELAKLNIISIVCLGKSPEEEDNKKKYKNISFFHSPVTFNGWKISNLSETIEKIDVVISETKPDLVILQIEVWDLMRELGKRLKGKVGFATVIHAMPFLGSPINPTGNYVKDVVDYANSGIDEYRKEYNLSHYKETEEVFKNVSIIAANPTVEFFFHKYFKDLSIFTLPPAPVVSRNKIYKINPVVKYELAFMARMEKGKGVEYLEEIFKEVSLILSKPIKVVIMGRTDDNFSKKALNLLLAHATKSKYFKIKFLGWVDDKTKKKVLPYCGVFVYPSYHDSYPTVLCEAFSSGLSCITWDVPFSQLNYLGTSAIKRVPPFNFKKFAEASVDALKNRNNLSKDAYRFINSFDSLSKIAKFDTEVFRKIAQQKYE